MIKRCNCETNYFVVLDLGNKPAMVNRVVRGEEGMVMGVEKEKGSLAREANLEAKGLEETGAAKGRAAGVGLPNLVRSPLRGLKGQG